MAELMANPLPLPPLAPTDTDIATVAPPHAIDGFELTIADLMVVADKDKPTAKDKTISDWLDEREQMGFKKMAETTPTGLACVDPATIRTLAQKYKADDADQVKCRGNAITRSCAFTGAFVILECGRRVLYRDCPGACTN